MNVLNVILKVRTKMAQVVVTLKIMPDNPKVNLEDVKRNVL